MAYSKSGKSVDAKNIARVLKRIEGQGVALEAVRLLVSGEGVGHLVVSDGKGNVAVKGLIDDAGDPLEGISFARREALERLGVGRAGDFFVEQAPFSEIFVELFNENPPFVEGPVYPGGIFGGRPFVGGSWNEAFDEGPFNEEPPFLEGPWNEEPPFVEGPWNEEPPFVEQATSVRGGIARRFDRIQWRLAGDPVDPGDAAGIEQTRRRSSVVATYARIIEEQEGSAS